MSGLRRFEGLISAAASCNRRANLAHSPRRRAAVRHRCKEWSVGQYPNSARGPDAALAVVWSDSVVQRRTAPKHHHLFSSAGHSIKLRSTEPLAGSAHAPERLHEEISNDDKDMIYADTKQEIATKRNALIRKRRLERDLKKLSGGSKTSTIRRLASAVANLCP